MHNSLPLKLRKQSKFCSEQWQEEPSGVQLRKLTLDFYLDVVKGVVPLRFETLSDREGCCRLNVRDRSFIHITIRSAFAHHGTIQMWIKARSRQSKQLHPVVSAIVILGFAQLIHLDQAEHAVVHSWTELIKSYPRLMQYRGFVHAMLMQCVREKAILKQPYAQEDLWNNLPEWMCQRWIRAYGRETVLEMLPYVFGAYPIDLSFRNKEHNGRYDVYGVWLDETSLRIKKTRERLSMLPDYEKGVWWVQSYAASLPVKMLNLNPNMTILDACASPGGKLLQLSTGGACHIDALEPSKPRFSRLRSNVQKAAVDVHLHHTTLQEFCSESVYDVVLLDSPCSGTGVIRKHPEIPWLRSVCDLLAYRTLQRELLNSAAQRVAIGGKLVYSVCSLELEEGEEQTTWFLETHKEFVIDDSWRSWLHLPAQASTLRGELRLLPNMFVGKPGFEDGVDGFYAVCFRRKR